MFDYIVVRIVAAYWFVCGFIEGFFRGRRFAKNVEKAILHLFRDLAINLTESSVTQVTDGKNFYVVAAEIMTKDTEEPVIRVEMRTAYGGYYICGSDFYRNDSPMIYGKKITAIVDAALDNMIS